MEKLFLKNAFNIPQQINNETPIEKNNTQIYNVKSKSNVTLKQKVTLVQVFDTPSNLNRRPTAELDVA